MPPVPGWMMGDLAMVKAYLQSKVDDPLSQRKLVLVIVCIALLLDNMLYMVIVPIIPDQLKLLDAKNQITTPYPVTTTVSGNWSFSHNNRTSDIWRSPMGDIRIPVNEGPENQAIGFLFASKAIVQICIGPFAGKIIDTYGYDRPMMFGLCIIFFSTTMFAFGMNYWALLFARSLQGVGSAFADTSGLAMIADRFNTNEHERTRALGIALAFISFGSLVAPPFGGILYDMFGMAVPFLFLALLALIDGGMLLLVMAPIRAERTRLLRVENAPDAVPIWKLFMDPYIAVAAGALAMSNVSLAFLEPTIAVWMESKMDAEKWQIGMIWLPGFLPHIGGVFLTVKLAEKYPKYQWLMALLGLALEGMMCLIIPFCDTVFGLILPIMGNCPTVGQLK